MNEEELQDFCIEHNLPFTVEFKESWYPKSIEISPSIVKDTRKLIDILNKAIFDYIIYGTSKVRLSKEIING